MGAVVATDILEDLMTCITSSDRDIRMSAMSSMIRLAKVLPEKIAPVRWAVSVMFADNDPLIREQFQKLRRAKHSRVHARFKQYDFLQDFDLFDKICLNGGSIDGQPCHQQRIRICLHNHLNRWNK